MSGMRWRWRQPLLRLWRLYGQTRWADVVCWGGGAGAGVGRWKVDNDVPGTSWP